MNRIIEADDFENMDSDMIFDYLSNEMRIVVFRDYLKRYLYDMAEISELPFSEVTDDIYLDIIESSFEETRTPYSLHPTTRKPKTVFKSFLTQQSVRREAVFLLGFGLHMSVEDVEEFLTKVLLEDSFRFRNVEEVVYWYCYKNGFSHAKAKQLLSYYNSLDEEDASYISATEKRWRELQINPRLFLIHEENVKIYLVYLKKYITTKERTVVWSVFTELYDKVRQAIADFYNKGEDPMSEGRKIWKKDQINSSDIEKLLGSGIPLTRTGNLEKMSLSLLSHQFHNRRMGRQHLSALQTGKKEVDRENIKSLDCSLFQDTKILQNEADSDGFWITSEGRLLYYDKDEESVRLPDHVTGIHKRAFEGKSLKTLQHLDSLKYIDGSAFFMCPELMLDINTLPKDCVYDEWSFIECPKIIEK